MAIVITPPTVASDTWRGVATSGWRIVVVPLAPVVTVTFRAGIGPAGAARVRSWKEEAPADAVIVTALPFRSVTLVKAPELSKLRCVRLFRSVNVQPEDLSRSDLNPGADV